MSSTELARLSAPSIQIDGQRLSEQLANDLLELRIARGTRTTGRATLTFVDRTFRLASSELKLGAAVKISSIEPAKVLMDGEITAVATEIDEDGVRATVTVLDATHVLARTRSVATFSEISAGDIISKIAGETGLSVGDIPSSNERPTWMWRADSMLGQIDELCERLGWEWILEADKKLRFLDVGGLTTPESVATLEWGKELVRFVAEQSQATSTEVEVRGWDNKSKKAIVQTATTPAERSGFKASGSVGAKKAVVTRAAVESVGEAKALARSLAAAAASVTARGRAYFAPGVMPGRAVTIKGAGPGDGTYYVREVEHYFDSRTMRTSFVAGFRPPTLVSDPWSSASTGSSIFASGVHTALVTNLEDKEGLGRVRIQMPGVSESDELGWARVLATGGGNGRGLRWLPEVNDEVLVAFEDGDVRRPVVVGGLYNKNDAPPGPVPSGGKVEVRTLKSVKGHAIAFGDLESGKGYVDITLGDGKVRLHLGEDRIDIETSDKPLRLGAGRDEIVLDGKGTVTIKADTIKLQATQDVDASGTNVKAKANGQLNLEGASTTLKASASLKVQSSGIAEIAGAMVKIN